MPKRKDKTDLTRLPIYEIVIDDSNTTGVKMVSLVDDPAIEVKGMFFKPELITPPCHFTSDGEPNCRCEIVNDEWIVDESTVCEFCLENKQRWEDRNLRLRNQKFTANTEQQTIVGPFLIPDINIYRRDDDGTEYYVRFSKEVIQSIVQKFNRGNNNKSINLMHTNTMAPAYILENWIIADSTYDKSKMYGYDLPVGSWFGVVKVEDQNFWNSEVKELGRYSFSVEGLLGQRLLRFALESTKKEDDLLSLALENINDKTLLDLANQLLRISKN